MNNYYCKQKNKKTNLQINIFITLHQCIKKIRLKQVLFIIHLLILDTKMNLNRLVITIKLDFKNSNPLISLFKTI